MAPTGASDTAVDGDGAALGSPTLHVLERRDIQRICSGQSVVDLATAVKELVENALDAGATQLEVKLKEFGRDGLEVSDNGSGIAPSNYDTLARKHYTSKIARFEDIECLTSFGFRGEALSSICELSGSFSVCTRTADEQIGSLLSYDSSGALIKQTKKARPVGTTVIVEELFKPLAVRHKDFHRNIKKHYAKLLKILQGYALSSTNVRFSVVNLSGKAASRQVVLATQSHKNMGENISSVFGTKFFRTLVPVEFVINDLWDSVVDKAARDDAGDDEDEEDSDERNDGEAPCRQVVGYVSKVGAGVGRSDNDRQFFFINGRPFELPKIAKATNEVWRQYEMKQKPACVLNFLLPFGEYDVNVTPDKRETFMQHEAKIVHSFKAKLNSLYEPSRGTFTVQPLLSSFTQPAAPQAVAKTPPASNPVIVEKQPVVPTPSSNSEANDRETVATTTSHTSTEVAATAVTSPAKPSYTIVEVIAPKEQTPKHDTPKSHGGTVQPAPNNTSAPDCGCSSAPEDVTCPTNEEISESQRSDNDVVVLKKRRLAGSRQGGSGQVEMVNQTNWSFTEMLKQRQTFFAEGVEVELKRQKRQAHKQEVPDVCSASNEQGASTDINDAAAAALQRVLKKEDFKQMEVLGQFNLGFIIGKLESDLFIIDQHASDEKYNFETLQQTTVMHQQPLVRPLPLELTAGEEMMIMDHKDVFAKNGFTFLVDKDAPATRKLKLLSLPFSKHTQFGADDIRELASLLMDAPLNPSSIRLPKVMSMFASRACRSSIMIGTALHKEEMQKIVRNLSGLEQPWNCPHGRPTLRHLADLDHLDKSA